MQLLRAGRLEEVLEQSKQRRLDGLLLVAQGAAVLLRTGAANTVARPGAGASVRQRCRSFGETNNGPKTQRQQCDGECDATRLDKG